MLVDASVAAKFFIPEPDSTLAIAIVAGQRLIAPDLVIAELANIIWKTHRRGLISAPDLSRYDFAALFSDVVPSARLHPAALSLAIVLNHPADDCFYLALAIAEDDLLITADRRFHAACAASPHAARVRLLG
jgi:predicted nucleic acid-binding protein